MGQDCGMCHTHTMIQRNQFSKGIFTWIENFQLKNEIQALRSYNKWNHILINLWMHKN